RIDRLAVDRLIGAGEDQVAVAIEDHHRLDAAVEHVDAILRIDGEPGDARLVRRSRPRRTRTLRTSRTGRTLRTLRTRVSARPPPRRRRAALGRGGRGLSQPEEKARRHLHPLRHEPVAAVSLRSRAARSNDDGQSDEEQSKRPTHNASGADFTTYNSQVTSC